MNQQPPFVEDVALRAIVEWVEAEWLEADGLGGFASGTVNGIRARRYHALLLTAVTPPTGRFVLVNGFDAWVDTPAGTFALSSQFYSPDVVHPDGAQRIESFTSEPWPRWCFLLEDGTRIEQEIFVRHGTPVVILSWRLTEPRVGVTLSLRPLLSGRDYHALHHENPTFRFDAERQDGRVIWSPYPDVPRIMAFANGTYTHQPDWYRNFLYKEEQARGLDHTEDLATPGIFHWSLSQGEAVLILTVDDQTGGMLLPTDMPAHEYLQTVRSAELQRRRRFPSRLHRAADAYLVRRGEGKTIVAGYPWFTDWGRDTFIALRGLCLAIGRLDEAHDILLAWAGTVSQGMLPNRFPDRGDAPEFNSVDASLWYIVAVHDFLQAMAAKQQEVSPRDQQTLRDAIDAILSGYVKGTRYNIHVEDDGLLAAGEPGVQLTWMDAKVGDWVITPRIGKPVEIEALWLNALHIGSAFSARWQELFTRGREAFLRRFWNEADGCLYDVVDVDHQPGALDSSFRPNQTLAVGGLPISLLDADRARRVVEAVEKRLWTPLGLRSLAPGEPGYRPQCQGGVSERDSAYHQGTVWPWLIGPFVEAWVRVHGGTPKVKRDARARYLEPLLRHLDEAGLGHISEAADGDSPHTPRGCPFQAWSVGEVLRLSLTVLAD
ncbi:MAG TPA: amylo-alpha-1,6-glucosidase [Candidatus Binatia bacterium]|jgi:predicted glycogen debranching enzyme|nr:amylo-alpha-1,6-glucosidase [Candidatus Binatia bacterium]